MQNILNRMKTNWKSGVTVSLISIPLSVSLAVASQSTPIAGIITAIWAGLIASLLGGSIYNIVGPTGALSGVIAAYALTHGADTISMLAIVTGIFVAVAYIFKLEKYLVFVPSSVMHGFTLGVAFIIGFGQFNYAFGLHGLTKHEKFISNLSESFLHTNQTYLPSLLVFLAFFIALIILRKLLPRVPGAIVLSPIGILLGYLGSQHIIPLQLDTLGSNFTTISGKLFQAPHLFFHMSLVSTGFAVALVAILETMLSAKIADGMTKTKHNERKEMLGLSLANIASGLTGGIPATAALARTSLNIKTGATDRMSGTINSISIAVISLLFLGYFKYIPMAVIASILAMVAVNMVETEHFIRYYRFDKVGFGVALLVAFVTVYEDPIVGILLGTAVALVIFMEKLSHGQFDLYLNKYKEGQVGMMSGEKLTEIKENPDILLYSFKGTLMYINSQAHLRRFETNLKGYSAIVLRLREVYFVDLDGVEALDEIIELIRHKGQKVVVTGVNAWIAELCEQNSKQYRHLKNEGLVFDKATQALSYLGVQASEATLPPATVPVQI